jgi:hypothetical protein
LSITGDLEPVHVDGIACDEKGLYGSHEATKDTVVDNGPVRGQKEKIRSHGGRHSGAREDSQWLQKALIRRGVMILLVPGEHLSSAGYGDNSRRGVPFWGQRETPIIEFI